MQAVTMNSCMQEFVKMTEIANTITTTTTT